MAIEKPLNDEHLQSVNTLKQDQSQIVENRNESNNIVEKINGLAADVKSFKETQKSIHSFLSDGIGVLESLANQEIKKDFHSMPKIIFGYKLEVAKNHPFKEEIQKACQDFDNIFNKDILAYKIINTWFSVKTQTRVYLLKDPVTGKISHLKEPALQSRIMFLSDSILTAKKAWTVEAEQKAQQKLQTHLTPSQFASYFLTGTFKEKSKRGGVLYIFRRSRPTIALSSNRDKPKILCTLCLHPIAYYSRTWTGAMVPTDEVIDHLLRMRADEPGFWRKSNQHPAWHPESGL